MKKIPYRKCLVLKKTFPKESLFRVVKTPNNEVLLDISLKSNGRGAYIFKSEETIKKAKESKCLDHELEIKVPDEIYDRMLMFLKMK